MLSRLINFTKQGIKQWLNQLSPANSGMYIFQMCEAFTSYIIKLVKLKKFTLYGAARLEKDVSTLIRSLQSLTTTLIKKCFLKLSKICALLTCETIDDMRVYISTTDKSVELEEFIKLRVDIN
jgi:hypothetical protein